MKPNYRISFHALLLALVALAYRIGEFLLHVDAMTGIEPISETMQIGQTGHLLQRITGAGLDTALGLLVIASLLASVGYVVSGIFWRWWVGRRRRLRLAARRLAREAAAA